MINIPFDRWIILPKSYNRGMSIDNEESHTRANTLREIDIRSIATKIMMIATRSPVMMTTQQLNILLVEDDEVDVMNVQRALKKNGATADLYRAANGIEALAMLRTNDQITTENNSRLLILLDLNMPQMGGLEFLKELRADPALSKLPVVILTTSMQDSDLATAYQYNVAGYIIKPITFSSFVETIDVLNRYWSMSEMPV
jgi:CheY-like chemotaxis protein